MKKAAISFWLLLFTFPALNAQIVKSISWTFSVKQVNDSEYSLVSQATIQKGWHMYSQFVGDGGPVATAFTYTPSADYSIEGKTTEGTPITKFEKAFSMEVKYFEGNAEFAQKIIVHNKNAFTIKGNVYGMTCNDSMCLPPKQVDFVFNVPASPNLSKSSDGFWAIFLAGMGAGLLALLTPCVFPMIPLTVSFFIKRSQSSRKKAIVDALVYSASIIAMYVLLGVLVTAIFGKDGLNSLASNEWVNLIFFTVFILFGFSFLGAFEIALPSSWANKLDQASERGGISGIFFMALTLSVVSFSCTGPVLGTLITYASQSKHYGDLAICLFGFSFALSLPFALFAVFPSWLKSLPKSGGWLNSVKVTFGLFELAFALKFLSITDLQGLHIGWLHVNIEGPLHLLHREVFLVLWIVIFTILGFYLLGKLKFQHDSDVQYVSVFRLTIAILAFAFAMYLIPGIFGAPLKLISGFPPPAQYNEGWKLSAGGVNIASVSNNAPIPEPKAGTSIACPLDLSCLHDYDEAVAYAKKVNKPIMIDFTGISCTNCRRMEENVWSDPKVLAVIQSDYVLVSLYVDDRTFLPDSMKFTSKGSGDKIRTYGEKWADLEATKYNTNSQPFYVLVDVAGTVLTTPRGYTPDIGQYLQFLKDGKANFHPVTNNFAKPSVPLTP